MNPYYVDFAEYMNRIFPNFKVQKVSINSGGTCPNRDGTIGTGGCIYCNNTSFTPAYCFQSKDPVKQLHAGIQFFEKKYTETRFLAYFQSYTNTYGKSIDEWERIYREIGSNEKIAGIIIGTRPDCLEGEMIKMLGEVNKDIPVFVELGVETIHDATLRIINRGHDSDCSIKAIERLSGHGLHTGVHLIAGLPGETLEDALDTVSKICRLHVESIKLHHLQVLKGTHLYRQLTDREITIHPFDMEEYLEFCIEVVRLVDRKICIERFLSSAPPEMVISPKWGLKNYEFTNLLINKLRQNEKK